MMLSGVSGTNVNDRLDWPRAMRGAINIAAGTAAVSSCRRRIGSSSQAALMQPVW
jgi:hypothetical protein